MADIETAYVGMQHNIVIGRFTLEESKENGKRKEVHRLKLRAWKL